MKLVVEMKSDSPSHVLIHIVLVTLLGGLIYSNTFDVQYVFDDFGYIVDNPAVKDFRYFLAPTSVLELDSVYPAMRYAFMTRIAGYLTFALNYHLHGLDLFGYHAFNLLIHMANATLVYFFIRLILSAPFFCSPTVIRNPHIPLTRDLFAFFCALLFVSHPIQTQAVTYITQRFTSLSTLFYLLALATYIKQRLSTAKLERFAFYGISLGVTIVAMFVKEISVTLPAIIVLIEVLFFDGKVAKRSLLLLPFLLTMLIIPISLATMNGAHSIADFDQAMRTLATSPTESRWDYLLTQFTVIVTYIRLLFLPMNQNLDYDYPVYSSFFEPAVFSSFLGLLCLLVLGIYLLHRSKSMNLEERHEFRLIAFGILWFFTTLSVESSIIPIKDLIFEHRLYLPSVGFILAVMTAIGMVMRRVPTKRCRELEIAVLSVVVVLLAGATHARNSVWGTEVRIWEDAVEKSPLKARTHNNLGKAYERAGRTDEAMKEFSTAIARDAEYPLAHHNLAVMYTEQGRVEDAIQEYLIAIQLDPSYADTHNNLGVLYEQAGRIEEATREYLTARSLNPDSANVHYNLGKLHDGQGRIDDAIAEYLLAIAIDPDHGDAHNNLAINYAAVGRTEEAIQEFLAALKMKSDSANVHNNLGIMYGKQGRVEDAMNEFLIVVRLRPEWDRAHYNLGVSYGMQGRSDEALRAFQTTLDLNPEHAGARRGLEDIMATNR